VLKEAESTQKATQEATQQAAPAPAPAPSPSSSAVQGTSEDAGSSASSTLIAEVQDAPARTGLLIALSGCILALLALIAREWAR
jgi:hypothetical protein